MTQGLQEPVMELHCMRMRDGVCRCDVLRLNRIYKVVVLVPHDINAVGIIKILNVDVQKAARLGQ